MPLVARITFVVLVLSTFAAFFVAQRLKSEPPVINVPQITTSFSPNGDGYRDVSKIAVFLKVADEATVDVVNLDGDRVRRLADSVVMEPNRWQQLEWDARGDDGAIVPDGQYRLRVALRDEGRSAIVQKTMTVDTKAPSPEVCIGGPCSEKDGWQNIVSQGDRAIDIFVKGRSRFTTNLRVYRTDQGGEPKLVHTLKRSGRYRRLRWDGRLDNGKPLDPGVYLIQARVRDTAGNVGVSPTEFEPGAVAGRPGLTVRGLTAQPPVRPVTAGGRTEFFVDARGAEYRWRVRRVGQRRIVKDGTATDASLVFRAPEGHSGVYLLELRADCA
jgi:flagellar hook assembly protein FlgD